MLDKIAERVATNAAFLFASQIITGVLSLVTMVLIPRAYGALGGVISYFDHGSGNNDRCVFGAA